MMTHEIDDDDIERMTDIIGDGELTAEAQQRLHREGLWPLYESLRQTAYAAFVFGPPKWVALAPQPPDKCRPSTSEVDGFSKLRCATKQ